MTTFLSMVQEKKGNEEGFQVSHEELIGEILRLSEENQKLKDQRTMLQKELLKNA